MNNSMSSCSNYTNIPQENVRFTIVGSNAHIHATPVYAMKTYNIFSSTVTGKCELLKSFF